MAVQNTPKTVLKDFNLDASVPEVQPVSTQVQQVENTGGLSEVTLGPSSLDADTNTVVPERPTVLAAIGSGMFTTALDWYGGYKEDFKFEKDPYYNPKEDADEWFKQNDTLSADEVEYLNGAESYDAFNYRTQRLLDRRMRMQVQAERPFASAFGSLADADLVANLIPVIGQSKTVGRLGAAASGATAATAINLGNENSIRTDGEQALDALTFGVGGLFSNVRVGSKAGQTMVRVEPLEEAVEQEINIVKGRLRVQSGQVLTEADMPKPTLRLYAGIDDAVKELQAEQATKASISGSVGEAEIMGVPVQIPISQPTVSQFKVPDWYANTFGKWIESSADKMYRLTGKDSNNPLNNLLATPRTQGDNATYHASAVQNELEAMLVRFEDDLDTATSKIYGTRSMGFSRADHIKNQQEVMKAFQEGLQAVDRIVVQREKAGIKTTPEDIEALIKDMTKDEHIQNLQLSYVKSGFAETAYDHMRRVGLIDEDMAEKLTRRSTYLPLRHSYDKLNSTLKSGIDPDTLYKFIGEQIMRMYPTLQGKDFTLTAKQLGQNFIRTQERANLDLADMTSTGISKDRMRELLSTGTKLSQDQIDEVLGKLVPASERDGSNAMKNLRQRIDWDWDFKVQDKKTGRIIGMADIVDTDVALTLNDYARTTSKRVGLAQYGYKTPADLDDALEALVSNRPPDVSLSEARNFAKNVRASLMGMAVGEELPAILRSLNTVGGSMVLSNSGIWGVMDLATQTMKLGLLRSMPHLLKGMKHAVKPLKGLSKSEANSLYDVFTQRLSTEGRWRNFSMRFEDNFEVSKGFHERIAFYGQGTRFMNLSESVKRMQVGIMGGVFTSAFEGAAKGNARDIKFLTKNLKMSDELVRDITKEWNTHGAAIDNWNARIRVAMEQKVFFEADNLAHTIRTGELPAMLEHSSVGKVIFPFLSFTMAMQQKVLNHTMQRDGIAGLAMLLAVQLPMSVLLGMTKNIKDGKEPDEKLASTSMTALSMLGVWSIPLGAINQGGFRGGATAFTPFNKGLGLANKLFSEDADVTGRDIKSATPFVGSLAALDFVLSAIEDEE